MMLADRPGSVIALSDYTKAVIAGGRQQLEEGMPSRAQAWLPKWLPRASKKWVTSEERAIIKALDTCLDELGYIDDGVIDEISSLSGTERQKISEIVLAGRDGSYGRFGKSSLLGHRAFPPLFSDPASERAWYFSLCWPALIESTLGAAIWGSCFAFGPFFWQAVRAWSLDGLIFEGHYPTFLAIFAGAFLLFLFETHALSHALSALFPSQAARRHSQALGIA